MNASNDNEIIQNKPEGQNIRPGTVALVQGEGFRCLACIDKDGRWTDRHGKVLSGKVRFIEEADYQMQKSWSNPG